MKSAWIFPGQGAQKSGMGFDFYQNFREARDVFDEADHILGAHFSKLIFEGDPKTLALTKNSQLSIFITSYAIFKVVSNHLPLPVAMGGLSLGEYSALCASGRIDFADCVKLVALRGELMHQASIERAGTMAAVIGFEVKNLPKDVWIANLNCPGQVVISGTHEGVAKAIEMLKQEGARKIIPLDVSGAFHSGLMQSAMQGLKEAIDSVELRDSDILFVSNASGDFVKDLSQLRSLLVDQVVKSVKWESDVRAMLREGITRFIEIGPGTTLAGMNRKIGECETYSIGAVKQLEEVLNEIA